jgi:hypothetical protein
MATNSKTTKPLGGYDRIFAGQADIPEAPLTKPWLCATYVASGIPCKVCGFQRASRYDISIVTVNGEISNVGCVDCVSDMTQVAVDTMRKNETPDTSDVSSSEKETPTCDDGDEEGKKSTKFIGDDESLDDQSSDSWITDDELPHKRKAHHKQKKNENKKKSKK